MRKETRWTHFGEETEIPEAPELKPAPEKTAPEAGIALRANRVRFLIAFFAIFGLAVLVRMVNWQVLRFTRSAEASTQTSDFSRGRIVDSHGLLLATDSFTWEVYADPQEYRNDKFKPNLNKIAAAIDIPVDTLATALAQDGTTVVVTRGVSEAQCLAAKHAKDVPLWVWCDGRRKRVYPQGTLAAHVVGFTDKDQLGRTGLEASYDGWLRAAGNWQTDQLPGQPELLPDEWKDYLPSPAGRDLVLHLDAGLQYQVEKRLAEALTKYEAKAGTIIVMNPRTGALLAVASLPTYDPNKTGETTLEQVTDSAVSEPYEPGSAFKLVTYAAGLDTKRITPDTLFSDAGKLEIGNRIIRNAENKTYGTITARQALANSVNTVSARICLDMGRDDFYRYIRQFGFGRPTEVDLAHESPGIVKRPGTEAWSQYDQAANSFGQGISVTPIQLISAAATIANGGTAMQPQVVRGLVWNGNIYNLPPRQLGQPIKPETARTLTQMLVFTVDNYVAGKNLVPGYRVAGKTGTAEIPIPETGGYTSDLTITSFVGFLPAADPQVVILVKLVEPKASRWAEKIALPVFGQVAQDAVRVLKIPPDDRAP
jgi:cell division protein FtsI (penicillin-binding protein 3)